jgi:signal transduction histidine kinase
MPADVPAETQRLESHYQAILELAALDKSNFGSVLRKILAVDARELDLERVNCWTLDDRSIRCVAGYLRATDTFEAGTVIEATSCLSYFRALADDPVILADHARTDPRTCEFTDGYLVPLGITSMMDVPVWVRGRLWGVVCHEHVGPARRWTDAERDFAISIGHIVSMAVEARERADAERIARFSEFFIGVLGHDLRNPLATIRAAAEMLREGETDIGRHHTTQRITRNAELMSRMIEQLLDFTRIRLGAGIPIERGTTDVAALARQVVSDLPPNLASRVDVDGHGNATGAYDGDRIWQAVSNLVSNALNHGSPSGRVRVVVDGDDPRKVLVKVTNAGVIAEDLQLVLFDPFQSHRLRDRERSLGAGLGLGLYIVREIVTAHHGTIGVTSDAGEVTFTISLPRRPPSDS